MNEPVIPEPMRVETPLVTTATHTNLLSLKAFAGRSLQYLLVLSAGGVAVAGLSGLMISILYWLLVILPGAIWVQEANWLEGFVLSNLIGFAMAGGSVALELLFGLPLSAPVFILVPLMFLSIGAWLRFKNGVGHQSEGTS